MIGDLHLEELQPMYRSVIRAAMRDLAFGSVKDVAEVRTWVSNREQFDTVCHLANWNEAWLRGVFAGILRIEGPIRKPITTECIAIMGAMVKLTAKSRHDNPPVVLYGSAQYTIADDGKAAYVDTPIGQRPRRRWDEGGERDSS